MKELETSTEEKLYQAFNRFRKTGWHEKQIAGYNPSEIKVLFTIQLGTSAGKADMKVSEISQTLHVTSPTVTQIVNKLEKDGLVIRTIDPTDRRAVRISLSEAGKKVVLEAKNAFSAVFAGLIDYLGAEDSEKLAELLTKVFDYYQQTFRQ